MRPLNEHAFQQRKATLIAKLDALGDVTIDDARPRPALRVLDVRAEAPGFDLARAAAFEYREAFRLSGGGRWEIARYVYEYREVPGPGRRAYHWHDERFHAHCVSAGSPDRSQHYRATEIEVFEAHDEFARLYATEARVRCDDLRPALVSATATELGR